MPELTPTQAIEQAGMIQAAIERAPISTGRAVPRAAVLAALRALDLPGIDTALEVVIDPGNVWVTKRVRDGEYRVATRRYPIR